MTSSNPGLSRTTSIHSLGCLNHPLNPLLSFFTCTCIFALSLLFSFSPSRSSLSRDTLPTSLANVIRICTSSFPLSETLFEDADHGEAALSAEKDERTPEVDVRLLTDVDGGESGAGEITEDISSSSSKR